MLGVIFVLVLGALALLTLVGTVTRSAGREARRLRVTAQVRVELHGVRRNLENAQLRLAIKGDAARLRRELDQELAEVERMEAQL